MQSKTKNKIEQSKTKVICKCRSNSVQELRWLVVLVSLFPQLDAHARHLQGPHFQDQSSIPCECNS